MTLIVIYPLLKKIFHHPLYIPHILLIVIIVFTVKICFQLKYLPIKIIFTIVFILLNIYSFTIGGLFAGEAI